MAWQSFPASIEAVRRLKPEDRKATPVAVLLFKVLMLQSPSMRARGAGDYRLRLLRAAGVGGSYASPPTSGKLPPERLERFPHDVGHVVYPACLK